LIEYSFAQAVQARWVAYENLVDGFREPDKEFIMIIIDRRIIFEPVKKIYPGPIILESGWVWSCSAIVTLYYPRWQETFSPERFASVGDKTESGFLVKLTSN
jgi:hypothetical protein